MAFYHFSFCGLTGGLSWLALVLVSLRVSQAVAAKWWLGLDHLNKGTRGDCLLLCATFHVTSPCDLSTQSFSKRSLQLTSWTSYIVAQSSQG